MDFRTDSSNQRSDQEQLQSSDPGLRPSDDQRSHPRGGTIEKIADIAYDTLRKYEGPWHSDDRSENSNDTP